MIVHLLCAAGIALMVILQLLTRKVQNSFLTRLLSGILLVLAALLFIRIGGWLLFFVSLALSLIGCRELFTAIGVREEGSRFCLLEMGGYAAVLLYYLALSLQRSSLTVVFLLFGVMLVLCIYVFTYPRYRAEAVMGTCFGVLYVGVMLSFVYQTRMLATGRFLVWLIFLCAWGCDTCAYCAGRLFGRHKMSPVLSPKKTIEGAVGGAVGALALGIIYALLTHGPVLEYALICLIGALISMVGDLAASAIKRNFNIKDYGKLIPGHGGVLDRFDSIIFTAPVIYFLSAVFIK